MYNNSDKELREKLNRELFMYEHVAEKFRDEVNRDQMFFNSQSKINNNWNIICSCMDWLTHAGNQLDKNYNEKLLVSKNTFEHIVPYIAYIDIFLESYLQLYRCIMNVEYNNSNIYENQNLLFKNSVYYYLSTNNDLISEYHGKNDFKTFKHIRAMLGMHPNNLTIKSTRYYASWCSCDGEYIKLALWSSNGDKHVRIKLKDLQEFLDDIVSKIENLMFEIPNVINEHINVFKNKPIENNDDIFQLISNLKNESNQRVPSCSLNEYLDEYEYILKVDRNTVELNAYKEFIIEKIKLMKDELQNMVISSDYSYSISQIENLNIDSYVIEKIYHGSSLHYEIIKDELQETVGSEYKLPERLVDKNSRVEIWAILFYIYIYKN